MDLGWARDGGDGHDVVVGSVQGAHSLLNFNVVKVLSLPVMRITSFHNLIY